MTRPKLSKFLLQVVGFCFCFVAFTQSAQASLLLKVVDSLKQPMPDVTVTVTTVGFGINSKVDYKTDCDGQFRFVLTGGSSCALLSYSYLISKSGYTFSPSSGAITCGPIESLEIVANGPAQAPRTLATVSAASYLTGFATESIAASFGNNLASTTEVTASIPLPTTLANRMVLVTDSTGAEKLAPLFFVSSSQINFLIPKDTALGNATITVVDSNRKPISTGCATVRQVAPSLFTAAQNGQGLAAAVVLRVKPDGSQRYEPVAQFDAAQNKFIPVPIDLGPEMGAASDKVFLVLFGCGWRNLTVSSGIYVELDGLRMDTTYAGPQPDFIGLDQFNVLLPRYLAGKGMVNVVVTGSNTVQVSIK